MAHWEDVLAVREVIDRYGLGIDRREWDHVLLHVVATYADELVRTDGGWKIASRRVDDFLWRRESTTS
jgi:hypothetical protein